MVDSSEVKKVERVAHVELSDFEREAYREEIKESLDKRKRRISIKKRKLGLLERWYFLSAPSVYMVTSIRR